MFVLMTIKKYTLLVVSLLVLVASSCKKESNAHYSMTIKYNDSTNSSTGTVTAQDLSGYLTITGWNPQTNESISFSVNNFTTTSNSQTFVIIPNGSVSSTYFNNAYYSSPTANVVATSGQIAITAVSDQYIIGTFDFYGGGHVTGTFQAPRP